MARYGGGVPRRNTRKRREHKLGTDAGANELVDPSVRLRTVPRLFESKTPTSRPGTPVVVPPKMGASPPLVQKAPANGNGNGAPAKTFEGAILGYNWVAFLHTVRGGRRTPTHQMECEATRSIIAASRYAAAPASPLWWVVAAAAVNVPRGQNTADGFWFDSLGSGANKPRVTA
ncbi:hypothetical protein C8R44DRAFT_724964 [Mycena epipterygia]|nr:hypothetical protein C8R44DRAFT_724964 [Mycena epipterygia]